MMNFTRCKRYATNVAFQMGMVALFVLLFPMIVTAQDNLPRLIAIIDPYPAGGLGDILPRALANVLSEQTGHTFIIENKPGAGSNIDTRYAAAAEPDGYTIFVSTIDNAINATLYKNLPFDVLKDFSPVILAATAPNILIVNPLVPAKSGFLAIAARTSSSPTTRPYSLIALSTTARWTTSSSARR